MKELIDERQAHLLMLAVLVAASAVGLIWGVLTKKLATGLVIGLLAGVGNYALWTIYNVITDKLGLDTVKNLLVNLVLFVVVGVVIGLGVGWYVSRRGSGVVAVGSKNVDV